MSLAPLVLAPLAAPFFFNVALADNNGGFDNAQTTSTETKNTKSTETKTASETSLTVKTTTNSAGTTNLLQTTSLVSEGTAGSTAGQTNSASYNQWGFTGSQSRWGESTESNSVTVVTESGRTITRSVAASSSGTQSALTVSKTSSSSLSSSSSSARQMRLVGERMGWKKTAAVVSMVALTVGLHCL